jgi:hypothetical protein
MYYIYLAFANVCAIFIQTFAKIVMTFPSSFPAALFRHGRQFNRPSCPAVLLFIMAGSSIVLSGSFIVRHGRQRPAIPLQCRRRSNHWHVSRIFPPF